MTKHQTTLLELKQYYADMTDDNLKQITELKVRT